MAKLAGNVAFAVHGNQPVAQATASNGNVFTPLGSSPFTPFEGTNQTPAGNSQQPQAPAKNPFI